MLRFSLVLPLLILAVTSSASQDKKKPAPKSEPRVLLAIPLGATPGKTSKLTIRGKNLDYATEVKVQGGAAKILGKGKAGVPDKNPDQVGDTQVEIELKLDANLKGDSMPLLVVTPNGTSKPHIVLVGSATAEKEPNDGFRAAQAVALPIVIEGTISRAKDVDVFRFDGKKGQKLHAEVRASRHGSPLDAMLTLYDANGQELASNDDFASEHHDAKIEATLPADGVYYFSLLDANDTGSSLHVYRLVIK